MGLYLLLIVSTCGLCLASTRGTVYICNSTAITCDSKMLLRFVDVTLALNDSVDCLSDSSAMVIDDNCKAKQHAKVFQDVFDTCHGLTNCELTLADFEEYSFNNVSCLQKTKFLKVEYICEEYQFYYQRNQNRNSLSKLYIAWLGEQRDGDINVTISVEGAGVPDNQQLQLQQTVPFTDRGAMVETNTTNRMYFMQITIESSNGAPSKKIPPVYIGPGGAECDGAYDQLVVALPNDPKWFQDKVYSTTEDTSHGNMDEKEFVHPELIHFPYKQYCIGMRHQAKRPYFFNIDLAKNQQNNLKHLRDARTGKSSNLSLWMMMDDNTVLLNRITAGDDMLADYGLTVVDVTFLAAVPSANYGLFGFNKEDPSKSSRYTTIGLVGSSYTYGIGIQGAPYVGYNILGIFKIPGTGYFLGKRPDEDLVKDKKKKLFYNKIKEECYCFDNFKKRNIQTCIFANDLEKRETWCKHGYNNIEVVNGTCDSSCTPDGAPRNFTGLKISSSEIQLFWYDVKEDLQNGEIIGYKIYFHPKDSMSVIDEKDVLVNSLAPDVLPMTCIVNGLSVYTEYNMTILAYNTVGLGIISSAILVFTDSDKPSDKPSSLRVKSKTNASLFIQWKTCNKWQGPKLGFTIQTAQRIIRLNYTEPSLSGWFHYNITKLQANTSYDIKVKCKTDKGDGLVAATLTVKTASTPTLGGEWLDAKTIKDGYCTKMVVFSIAFLTKTYYVGDCISAKYKNANLEACFMLCCKHDCRGYSYSPTKLCIIYSCRVYENSRNKISFGTEKFQYFQ